MLPQFTGQPLHQKLWVETELQGKELRCVRIEGDHGMVALSNRGAIYGQYPGNVLNPATGQCGLFRICRMEPSSEPTETDLCSS
jgi:hypothetical protein